MNRNKSFEDKLHDVEIAERALSRIIDNPGLSIEMKATFIKLMSQRRLEAEAGIAANRALSVAMSRGPARA